MAAVPRIAGIAEMRVVTGRVLRELGHVQRAAIDRAGGVETLQHGGGDGGHEVAADLRAAGRNLPGPVIHVLVQHQHAGKLAAADAGAAGAVLRRGGLQRLLAVEADDAVDLHLMRVDAADLRAHHRLRRRLALREGGVRFRQRKLGKRAHRPGSRQSRSACSKSAGSISKPSPPRSFSSSASKPGKSASATCAASFGGCTPDQRAIEAMSSVAGSASIGGLLGVMRKPNPDAPGSKRDFEQRTGRSDLRRSACTESFGNCPADGARVSAPSGARKHLVARGGILGTE